MKSAVILMLILILLPLSTKAQDTTSNSKIDTILSNSKKILDLQQKTYNEVAQEPLANKHMGIELNPANLLVASANDILMLSGGFSLFAVDRHAEIAFPFFYQSGAGKNKDYPLTLLTLDAAYRRFLSRHQDGFYLSAGTRYTYIKGEEGSPFLMFTFNTPGGAAITTSKMGLYFGIGYRYFSESGLYWGFSISYGRYFSDDERDIKGVTLDDSKILFDVELLKFGIAF
jgi:hypothetical protein